MCKWIRERKPVSSGVQEAACLFAQGIYKNREGQHCHWLLQLQVKGQLQMGGRSYGRERKDTAPLPAEPLILMHRLGSC